MNGLAGIPNIRRTILFVFRYMEIVCKFVGWNCGIDRNPINSVIFKFSFNHKSMFKDNKKKMKKKNSSLSFSCPVGNWYSVRDVSRGLCIVEIRPADQPETDSRSSCPPVDIYCVIFLPFTCATIFLSNLKCWIHSFENWNNVKVARTATIYWLWIPCSTQVPRYILWIFIG